MENDGFSDKSELHDDWDTTANENGGRLTEESDMEQSEEAPPAPPSTAYVEQSTEEMAEVLGGWGGFHETAQYELWTSTCAFAGWGGVPGGDGV